MSDRAKELAEQHWDGYVGGLVAVHLTKDTYTKEEVLAMCRYHYVSSHIHGAKHQEEVQQETSGRTAPLRYPPAHPYKHKDEVVSKLCSECAKDCKRPESDNVSNCDGYSIKFPSHPADPWAERDLCRRCGRDCAFAGTERHEEQCHQYRPQEA